MSVLVRGRIPNPFDRKFEVNIEASSVREAMQHIGSQDEEFKVRLLDDSGELRRYINVYVNEEEIRFLQKLDTPLKAGDEVTIIPSIS